MKQAELIEKFTKTYSPLLSTFIDSIQTIVNKTKMPEPFLPVFGVNYASSTTKIMFMGWETRNAQSLKEFINANLHDSNGSLYWWKDDFDNFDFVNWGSNTGKDFWSFNLRFLASFYGINDWRELRDDPYEYEEILSSFVWANTDSIERFKVTAKANGVNYTDWEKLKIASRIFDDPPLIFNTFQPNIVVLMNWNQDEQLLLKGLKIEYESKPRPDYLWYYKIINPNTHLFWIKHPLRMHFESINYNDLISEIIEIYKSNANN
jgi:hypothetical protein